MMLYGDCCCQLLKSERLTLFAATVRVCFLLFESMRSQLKLQLEVDQPVSVMLGIF